MSMSQQSTHLSGRDARADAAVSGEVPPAESAAVQPRASPRWEPAGSQGERAMRRPLLFALIAAIVILLGVAAVLFVRYRKTTEEYTDMKAAEETARTGYA